VLECFFSIRVLRLFGFTVFLRHSVHMISRFYVCRPSIQRSISHETAIRQYLQSGVCDQQIFLSKYAEYVWRCSVKNVSRKCDVSNKHGLWVLTNVPDKQIQWRKFAGPLNKKIRAKLMHTINHCRTAFSAELSMGPFRVTQPNPIQLTMELAVW